MFVADHRLRVWDLSALTPRELKGAGELGSGESAPAPFWFPDGESIAYFAGARLWTISAQDGPPVAICNTPGSIVGGAWRPDGTIVFSTLRGPMYEVPGGDRIYAVTGERRDLVLSMIRFEGGTAPVFGRSSTVFTTSSDQLSLIDGLAASADGRSFLTIRRQRSGPVVDGMVVVQNWISEFQRR